MVDTTTAVLVALTSILDLAAARPGQRSLTIILARRALADLEKAEGPRQLGLL